MSQLPPFPDGGGAIRTRTQLLGELGGHRLMHWEGGMQVVKPEILIDGNAAGSACSILLRGAAVRYSYQRP